MLWRGDMACRTKMPSESTARADGGGEGELTRRTQTESRQREREQCMIFRGSPPVVLGDGAWPLVGLHVRTHITFNPCVYLRSTNVNLHNAGDHIAYV